MQKLLIVLAGVLCLALPCWSAEKDILVIESYNKEFSWDASYKAGLASILSEHYDLHFFEMDTKRRPDSEYEQRADLAWAAYKELQPCLVILGDDNALKYLEQRFTGTSTPVVYLGINNNPRAYAIHGAENMTGVLERPLIKRNIAFLKKILPHNTDSILVLFDSGTTSQVIKSEVFDEMDTIYLTGMKVDIRLIGKFSEWQQSVRTAAEQGYDALVVGLYQTLVDDAGNHIPEEQVLSWTTAHTDIPPFALWDFTVGQGKTIGGYVLHGYEQGVTAAQLAMKILEGVKPITIAPVTAPKGKFLFSRSALRQWKLKLPPEIEEAADFID